MKFLFVFAIFLVLGAVFINTAAGVCVCSPISKPVCGKDGKTYNNACRMRCAKVELDHKGECKKKT